MYASRAFGPTCRPPFPALPLEPLVNSIRHGCRRLPAPRHRRAPRLLAPLPARAVVPLLPPPLQGLPSAMDLVDMGLMEVSGSPSRNPARWWPAGGKGGVWKHQGGESYLGGGLGGIGGGREGGRWRWWCAAAAMLRRARAAAVGSVSFRRSRVWCLCACLGRGMAGSSGARAS